MVESGLRHTPPFGARHTKTQHSRKHSQNCHSYSCNSFHKCPCHVHACHKAPRSHAGPGAKVHMRDPTVCLAVRDLTHSCRHHQFALCRLACSGPDFGPFSSRMTCPTFRPVQSIDRYRTCVRVYVPSCFRRFLLFPVWPRGSTTAATTWPLLLLSLLL